MTHDSNVVYTSESESPLLRADCPEHFGSHDDCHQECEQCGCGHACDDTCVGEEAESVMAILEALLEEL